MKKLALAVSALALSAAGASAADLAPRYTKAPAPMIATPYYDWSGFYLGINGGGGWAHRCFETVADAGGPFVPAVAEGCHDGSGGTVGGQIGYRWQTAAFVFGLEAQGNWADINGNHISIADPTVRLRSQLDSFGLFTGQVGYAWNNMLVYVKGGAAVTSNRYDAFDSTTGAALDSARETRWGAVVGVGGEYGFAPNWSIGIEYNHIFMGDHNNDFHDPAGVYTVTDRISGDVDLLTARLNFRFGGYGAPIAARY